MDAFAKVFKEGKVGQTEIKNILNQSDVGLRAEMFGKFLSNRGAKYGLKK